MATVPAPASLTRRSSAPAMASTRDVDDPISPAAVARRRARRAKRSGDTISRAEASPRRRVETASNVSPQAQLSPFLRKHFGRSLHSPTLPSPSPSRKRAPSFPPGAMPYIEDDIMDEELLQRLNTLTASAEKRNMNNQDVKDARSVPGPIETAQGNIPVVLASLKDSSCACQAFPKEYGCPFC